VAALWTAVTLVLLGVALCGPGGRWRRLGGAGLLVAATWGYFSVLYA
jgi:hypothetical protein